MEDNSPDLNSAVANNSVVHIIVYLAFRLSIVNIVTSGPGVWTKTSQRTV